MQQSDIFDRLIPVLTRVHDGERQVRLSGPVGVAEIVRSFVRTGNQADVARELRTIGLLDILNSHSVVPEYLGFHKFKVLETDLIAALSREDVQLPNVGLCKLHFSEETLRDWFGSKPAVCLFQNAKGLGIALLSVEATQNPDATPVVDELFVLKRQLAQFLSSPTAPGSGGFYVSLSLGAAEVSELIAYQAVRYMRSDKAVIIRLVNEDPGPSSSMVTTRHLWSPDNKSSTRMVASDDFSKKTDLVPHASSHSQKPLFELYSYIGEGTGDQPVGNTKKPRLTGEPTIAVSNPFATAGVDRKAIVRHLSVIQTNLIDQSLVDAFLDFQAVDIYGSSVSLGGGHSGDASALTIPNLTSNTLLVEGNQKKETSSALLQTKDNRAFIETTLDSCVNSIIQAAGKLFDSGNERALRFLLVGKELDVFEKVPEPTMPVEVNRLKAKRYLALRQIEINCPSLFNVLQQIHSKEYGLAQKWEILTRLTAAINAINLGHEAPISTRISDNDFSTLIGGIAGQLEGERPAVYAQRIKNKLGFDFVDDCGILANATIIHSGLSGFSVGTFLNSEPNIQMGARHRALMAHVASNWSFYAFCIFKNLDAKQQADIINSQISRQCQFSVGGRLDFKILGFSGSDIMVSLNCDASSTLAQLWNSSTAYLGRGQKG
jgi:hypothetical protein